MEVDKAIGLLEESKGGEICVDYVKQGCACCARWKALINQALSLLRPKPCAKCGGSKEKLISGCWGMVYKYIPCPLCSAGKDIEEFVKECLKEINEYSEAPATSLDYIACTTVFIEKLDQALTHLQANAKTIEATVNKKLFDGLLDDFGKLNEKYIKLQAKIKEVQNEKSLAEAALVKFEHLAFEERQGDRATIEAQAKRVEGLEGVLVKIDSWAKAYPLKVFPEPDFKKAAEVLKAAGLTLDAISASNMRHVISSVKDIVDQALQKEKEE